MDGILGKIGSILRISTKSDSANNRNFRARDIAGPVSVDQSNSNLSVNLPEELLDRNKHQEAAGGMWKALLEIKNNQITAVSLMDLFQPSDMSQMRKNEYFAKALKSLESLRDTDYLNLRSDAEKHRPYVSERLWNLYHLYFLLSFKPALLLQGLAKMPPTNRWWEDGIIREALQGDGMPKGIMELAYSAETPLKKCLEAIEEEVRLEVQSAK